MAIMPIPDFFSDFEEAFSSDMARAWLCNWDAENDCGVKRKREAKNEAYRGISIEIRANPFEAWVN
jgi:hypothetical protein